MMETERRIEKLLGAFAKKRKADAGAPLELHPVNRRLLQDEVARAAKKPDVAGGSFWQMLFGSIPRMAVSLTVTSALILLTINLLVWQPARKESQSVAMLAKNKSSAAKDLKKAEMPAPPVPPVAPPVATVQPDAPVVTMPVASPTPVLEIASAKSKPTEAVALDERKDMTKEMDRSGGMKVAVAPSVNAPAVASQNVGGGFGGGGGGRAGGRGGAGGGRGGGGGGFGGARQDGNGTLADSVAVSSANRDAGAAPSGATAPAPTVAMTLAFDKADTTSLAVAEAPVASASTSGTVSFYNLATAGGQNVAQAASQKFYRLRTAEEAAGGVKVLDSFSVEQSGDQITVVDADGSKYSGNVQIAAVNEENGFAAKQTSPVAQSTRLAAAAPQRRELVTTNAALAFSNGIQQQIAAQNFYFRVTGTNRTLNQAVVFNGNLVANTNAILLGNTVNSPAFQQVQPQVMQQLPLSNSRITGRAAVGGKGEIEINAAPVSP